MRGSDRRGSKKALHLVMRPIKQFATLAPGGNDMISATKTRGIRESRALAIVWRNPKQVPTFRRHSVLSVGEQPRYILEEFVEDGLFGHWAAISDLEVVRGGKAA